MADQIQELLQGQRALTNAIAHDLRTPLYRLRFAVEMLGDSNQDYEREKYWASITKSVDDLDHLVNQILQLSRYSSERQLVKFSEQDVLAMVHEECQQILPGN